MSEQTEVAARMRCSNAAIALSKMPPDAPAETVKALTGEMRDALDAYRTAILGEQAALVEQARRMSREDALLDIKKLHGDGLSWSEAVSAVAADALAAADAQKSADGA